MCHGGQFVYFGHMEKMSFFFMIIFGQDQSEKYISTSSALGHVGAEKFNNMCFDDKKLLCPRNSDGKDAGLRFLLRVTLKLKPISSILVQ